MSSITSSVFGVATVRFDTTVLILHDNSATLSDK